MNILRTIVDYKLLESMCRSYLFNTYKNRKPVLLELFSGSKEGTVRIRFKMNDPSCSNCDVYDIIEVSEENVRECFVKEVR